MLREEMFLIHISTILSLLTGNFFLGSIGNFSREIGGALPSSPRIVNKHSHQMKKQIANSHILLVEDDNINQMVAKHILEEANICVSTAQNGREAVDILNAAPSAFDLILMDIQMPILDGHNATRAIRKLTEVDSDLPIIAMTGHSMDCEKNKCVESGMNDHISKPLNAQQMYSSIAKWLANKP